ncbi:MAG: porphobilinogen synthase [Clostridia bacterium]|nr:porphobilinogen synthase [Clostridia bacterium]
MGFSTMRPRRLRQGEVLRKMVRENTLAVEDLIYPVFVAEGQNLKQPIPSMPDIFQFSIDTLIEEAKEVRALGIPALILFGLPSHKDAVGSEAYNPEGIVQRALRTLKQAVPDLYLITDVCLCEYTDHGHCGIVEKGQVLNDPSLELLAKTALSHAQAGADMVAPSDMMDGRVGAIRQTLDQNGYLNTPIMAYSVKYASAYYGPFREAADSAPQFGDRRAYQMDPANAMEAIRETELDIEEGADILMVKPALSYLDIVRKIKDLFPYPLAVYNVSGEYAMVKAAAQNGWVDEKRIVLESLIGMKRAGADLIITYHAKEVAGWLQKL